MYIGKSFGIVSDIFSVPCFQQQQVKGIGIV
jgi:hypothetical protein